MHSVLREIVAIRDDAIRRFVAWGADVKRRGDAGEFGKWPWQAGYDEVGLWGRRRTPEKEFSDHPGTRSGHAPRRDTDDGPS